MHVPCVLLGKRLPRRASTAVLLLASLACSLLPADDTVESGSVIPIGQTSAEQVGTPITVETLQSGTSSRRVRKAAIDAIPFHLMSAASSVQAHSIVDNLSLFRRLPTLRVESDRRCYEFFRNHPDVAVSIWRAMKISNVEMSRTSEVSFSTDTKDGTSGTVQVLLNTPEHCVVVCHGEFKSPAVSKPIQAVAMMHLQPQYDENGCVTHLLDMYVSFPSAAVEAIARLISPVSNRIADRNFEEVSLFVEMMSLAMARQPGWIEQIAQSLEGVPAQDRERLLKLTAEIYVDAVRAERAMNGDATTIDDVLPPTQTASLPDEMLSN